MTHIDEKTYGALLTATLPKKIETEEENERVLKIIKPLMKKGEDKLSPEEGVLLDLFAGLVEKFEDKTYPMSETSTPVTAMLFLMDQHNLKPTDMVDVFGSRGRVSDVINRTREISKEHARKLGEKFNVSPGLFV